MRSEIFGKLGLAAVFAGILLVSAPAANAEDPPCYECHDNIMEGLKVKHEPAAEGDCEACHVDHGDEEKLMLVAKGAALCSECHDDLTKGKTVHSPVADGDCTDCHNPHGSANPMMLAAKGAALCSECHDDLSEGKSVHSPVAAGACTACHSPHNSANASLLKTSTPDLCQKCHAKNPAFSGKVAHTALDDGCSDCHNPHNSANEKLLTKNLTLDRLAIFEPKQADLCLECHDIEAFTSKEGEDTGFRMGQKNLHSLHLLGGGGVPNKYGIVKKKDGQTCYACHLPHTAHQDMLLRTEYACTGTMCYTMRYVKNEVGGTCIVGCHKPKSYSRDGKDTSSRASLEPSGTGRIVQR